MHSANFWCSALLALIVVGMVVSSSASDNPVTPTATSVVEARARAQILHEAFHGALQVMHRDFFDEDDARVLPSGSLEDVFKEMLRSHEIKLSWLAVNAKAMNVDHEPKSVFEKAAAKAIGSGNKQYESIGEAEYRFAGSIRLASQCLKCHLPRRTNTKDRAAALVITMPLKQP